MTLQETMEAIGETLAEAVAIVDCGLRRDTPVVVWANALMQMHRAQGRSIEIGAALEATWEIADADALTAGLASGATFDLVLAPDADGLGADPGAGPAGTILRIDPLPLDEADDRYWMVREIAAADAPLSTPGSEGLSLHDTERLVARHVTESVMLTDAAQRIVWVNPAFEQMSGYPLARLRGRKPGALLQGDGTDPGEVARIGAMIRAGETCSTELLNYRRDGEPYWVGLTVSPIRDARGEATHFIGVMRDVTQRRRAETAMRLAQEQAADTAARLTRLTNEAPGLLFEYAIDAQGAARLRFASRGLEDVYGLSAQTACARVAAMHARLHPDDRRRVFASLEESRRTLGVWRESWRVRHPRRGEIWVSGAARPRREADGTVVWYGAMRETTQEREAEERTLLLALRLGLAVDAAGVGVWECDVESGAQYWDARMCAIYGRPETMAAVDRSAWLAMLHPQDRARVGPPPAALGVEDRFDDTFRILRPDGAERVIQSRAVTHQCADGRMRLIGVNWDITEQCAAAAATEAAARAADAARKAAEAATEAKSQFLALMSHEIRTPMNGVLGITRALSQTALDEGQQRMVRVIAEAGETLMRVLNDVLDFSRLEAGGTVLEQTRFNLESIRQKAENLHSFTARERGLDFTATCDVAAPERIGDAGRVLQIVHNLVNNALKFTETGAITLAIRDGATPDRIRLEIADTGCGMTPEQSARVLEPFAQAEASTARSHGGTGLGLSIVQGLARAMGGALEITSAPGEGSCFTVEIVLPSAAAADAAADAADDDDINDAAARPDPAAQAQPAQTAAPQPEPQPAPPTEQPSAQPTAQPSAGAQTTAPMAAPAPQAAQAAQAAPSAAAPSAAPSAAAATPAPEPAPAPPEPAPTATAQPPGGAAEAEAEGPLTILVADDNATNRTVIQLFLEMAGHQSSFATNGAEAVALFEDGGFDMVLMDISMPVMDGEEATLRIREIEAARAARRTPIIAVTAHVMPLALQHFVARGFDGYVPKPIDDRALNSEIRRCAKAAKRKRVTA